MLPIELILSLVSSKSKCDEGVLFTFSIPNLDFFFNPQTTDNVDLRCSATVWCPQTLGHFLLFWEVADQFIRQWNKFRDKLSKVLAAKCNSLLLGRKQVQGNYRSFLNISSLDVESN